MPTRIKTGTKLGGGVGAVPTIYEKATFDVNNTAINGDVCPHVIVKIPGMPFELDAKAKYTLTATFTATVNLVRGIVSTAMVRVTLPNGSTNDDLVTVLITNPGWLDTSLDLQMDDYLTVDVSASDGYADYRGAVTLVLKWRIT